jgi:hypothetical protein
MLFFRSEEHLDRWLSRQGGERGAVLTLPDTWRLSKAWYPDRRRREWAPRTVEESQRVLESVGLRGTFWALRPSV